METTDKLQINSNAQEVIESRYLWQEQGEKTWEDVATRIGRVAGSATSEPNKHIPVFTEMINDGLFIPGGRITRNAGRPRGSMFNCYSVPFGDSIEEIANGTAACMQLWKDGGGVGINWSTLRPGGTHLLSSGGESSGPISFLSGLNSMADAIRTGGQRRAAGIALLSISHPDILKFIHCKNIDKSISLFNISVGITEDFIDAVRNGSEWPLVWNNKVVDTIPAKELWESVIKGLSKNGEPGIINWDNFTINNSYYYAPITGLNPCGEACLEDWGACNLGSLVLKPFVSNGRVRWNHLEQVIHHAIRFLDHAIDVNKFTLPQVKQTAERGRRIGLGVMGLADMLLNVGVRYGSKESIDFVERLFKFIRNCSYEASIKLAVERGTFPAFDATQYCKSKFIRTLPASLRKDIRQYGTRNVTLLAIAPTGTISLVPECSSGIEPIIYKAYKRQDKVSTRYYVHPEYAKMLETGTPVPEYMVDSSDLKPIDHIEMQAVIQKYVDCAVSKTINIPADFNDESLSELLLESISDLKGVTVYRDGSREGQPIVPISEAEARKIVARNSNTTVIDKELLNCATGTCDI